MAASFNDSLTAATFMKINRKKSEHLQIPEISRTLYASSWCGDFHLLKIPGRESMSSFSSQMSGFCLINMELGRQKYWNTKLSVLPDLGTGHP